MLQKEFGLSEVQAGQSDITDEFCPELDVENENKLVTPKNQYNYSPSIPKLKNKEDMSYKYQHIRDGMRKVHPELTATYHVKSSN